MKVLKFDSVQALGEDLERRGIIREGIFKPLMEGQRTKTVADLFREVKSGECFLIEKGDALVRRLTVVRLFVYRKMADGSRQVLTEKRQLFPDGKKRERNINALSEKIGPDDLPGEGLRKLLREEAPFVNAVDTCSLGSKSKEEVSPSYTGFNSEYVFHDYEVVLPEDPPALMLVEPWESGRRVSIFEWETVTA